MTIRVHHMSAKSVAFKLLGIIFTLLSTNSPVWAESNQWINLGPGGGNIQALAIAPTTSTLYVGTQGGEIFKSIDRGGQWMPRGAGYNFPIPISCLAINPVNPMAVFAGTLGGVVRSLDGGANWNNTTNKFGYPGISSIAIDPLVPSNVYAGLSNNSGACRVLKSVDGGDNWVCTGNIPSLQPYNRTIYTLAVNPIHTSTVYAGTLDGLFISYDGGSQWTLLSNGFGEVYSLAIDPTNPNIFYAGNQSYFIYKSVDGGASWSQKSLGIPVDSSYFSGPSLVVVDPVEPNTVYATITGYTVSIFKSQDGGESWQPSSVGLTGGQISSIAVDPRDHKILYAGTGRGVFKSTDGGANWKPSGTGLPNPDRSLEVRPRTPFDQGLGIYAITEAGYARSTDSGRSWNILSSGLPRPEASSSTNPLAVYGVIDSSESRNLFKSTNGGRTWIATGEYSINHFLGPEILHVDPGDDNTLFAYDLVQLCSVHFSTILRKSTDSGKTWRSLGLHIGTGFTVFAWTFDPSDHNTIYAGVDGGVYKSSDGGDTWRLLGAGFGGDGYVTAIAIHPTTPDLLYAAYTALYRYGRSCQDTAYQLYVSADGGNTWKGLPWPTENKSISVVLPDHLRPNVIYVATADGRIFRSTDGGQRWGLFDLGIQGKTVSAMGLSPDGAVAFAATDRGIYAIDLVEAGQTAQIALTSPNGEESWAIGSTHQITWTAASSAGTVDLEFSADGGVSYSSIGTFSSNGVYTWTVPSTVSDKCLVRVSESGGGLSDSSDAPFSIRLPGFWLSSPSHTFDGDGGTSSVGYGAELPIPPVVVESKTDWITIIDTTNPVKYTVAPNLTGTPRSGTIVMNNLPFLVSQSAEAIRFVPIVLSAGGMNNSFYTSELTLTNHGSREVGVTFRYKGASQLGGGTGIASTTLGAGHQQIIPDAIDYLKSLGVSIPDSGSRGGTLTVGFTGYSSPSDVAATVRTTTRLANGRAGLAYAGFSRSKAVSGRSFICGLRGNEQDRSNLALQNVGNETDGDIWLRVWANGFCVWLIDMVHLAPGEFYQIPLGDDSCFSDSKIRGYVEVEQISGSAPYYAYGVVNDQVTSDGSFVPPITDAQLDEAMNEGQKFGLTIPVIVETITYSSELVLKNFYPTQTTYFFDFVLSTGGPTESKVSFSITLAEWEQRIIPNLIQYLRDLGVPGIGPPGPVYAGALFLTGGDQPYWADSFLGVRTSSPAAGGGRYGLFYAAVPKGQASADFAWLYGLQQNLENRSNLALVNTGEVDSSNDTFSIELYDGDTGELVNTATNITLAARGWTQINGILLHYAPHVRQGYARVVRTAGNNPFIAYAVVNDGSAPGEGTGDGAFIASTP